ncbi:MAG: replication initiation protein [Rudanella sp.]|nr:replication initiation protein [Rudanella sp.]
MAQNDITLYQHNGMTLARYEMSEMERNIIYLMMAQIRKEDGWDKLYYVHIKDIEMLTGRVPHGKEYKAATMKLITRGFTTKINSDLFQASFISSARYLTNQGLIEIGIDPRVRPLYVEFKEHFTMFKLAAALSLQSIYAKRIYELLCMNRNINGGAFEAGVTELKLRFNIIDDTGKDPYPDWTNFKKRVLDTAQREINEKSDITFQYLPVYGLKYGKGRKPVSSVKFTIAQAGNSPLKPLPALDETRSALFGRLVNDFKLRKDQAQKVLTSCMVKEITKKLYDIQLLVNDSKVSNIGSYTAKSFGVHE